MICDNLELSLAPWIVDVGYCKQPHWSWKSMNLSLIDPFILAQDYPESLTGKLSRTF